MKQPQTTAPRSREDLREVASKLQLAVDASGMGVWEFDEGTKQVHWDDRMLDIYGITDGLNQRPDDHWEKHIHPDDIASMIAYSDECRRNNTDFERDYRIIRTDGTVRYIRSLARTLSLPGQATKLIGVNIDMTEDHKRAQALKDAQKRLKHDAVHDVLTGLGNRRLLDEMIAAFSHSATPTDQYCLMILDLDYFKQVNDSLGHLVGDHVLKHVAHILRATISSTGTPFRTGGDEFVGFFPDAPPEGDIISLCDALVEQIAAPVAFEGDECAVGASIGYAYGMGPPHDPPEVFTHADAALYEAKRQGRSRFEAYRPALQNGATAITNPRRELQNAMRQNALLCHYQPQYDATSFDLIGAEALVRWQCPKRGLLKPDAFLGVARDNGMIAEIDTHVIGLVAAQQDAWAAQDCPYPVIAANFTATQLSDAKLIDTIRRTIKPHHRIALELRETSQCDHLDRVSTANLMQLRALGIRIDLGNFGSGQSSLVALQTIQPDRVKIDRSLVSAIDTKPQQLQILQTMSQLARISNAEVVLEGIETQEQLDVIAQVDCDVLQGVALQGVMTASDFQPLMQKSKKTA